MRTRRQSLLVLLAVLTALLSPVPAGALSHPGTSRAVHAVDQASLPAQRVVRAQSERLPSTPPVLDATTEHHLPAMGTQLLSRSAAPAAGPSYPGRGSTKVRGPPSS